jgi:cysteine desulfurase
VIYLDHHAATPVAPAVRRAIDDTHDNAWGNPASVHAAGRAARARVESARRALAGAIGAQPADLIFTAGGTESCNLAVLGLLASDAPGPVHIVTSELEHPAILQAIAALGPRARVTRLSCAGAQPPSAGALAEALHEGADLVALQWVNHETGSIAPAAEYARLCRERAVPLVVDACQALGKLPLEVGALGVTALVLASAKIGGPTGAAALWLERGRTISPISFGGAQERGRRAGTPDTAALVGFGAAALAIPARLALVERMAGLRARLEQACLQLGAVINASEGPRVATVVNASFRDWRGAELVAALDVEGLCASSGAACSSGLGAPSPVLLALYPDQPWRAQAALRLSLGPETSEAEVEQAIAILTRVLRRAA